MALTAQQIADKWRRNYSAANQAAKDGAMSVTTSPGQLAAQAVDKYVNNVQANKDKFVRRVSAISTNDWQQAYINKGIPRMQSGATNALPKVTAYVQQALPVWEQIKQQARAIPNNGGDDWINRVRVAVEGMRNFAKNRQ